MRNKTGLHRYYCWLTFERSLGVGQFVKCSISVLGIGITRNMYLVQMRKI